MSNTIKENIFSIVHFEIKAIKNFFFFNMYIFLRIELFYA